VDQEGAVQYSQRSVEEVFTLGETLGQGSYGMVRAATHKETGQQYAVKILQRRRGREDRTEVIENEVGVCLGRPPAECPLPHTPCLHCVHQLAMHVHCAAILGVCHVDVNPELHFIA
jgi:serine/threonine protein kinase